MKLPLWLSTWLAKRPSLVVEGIGGVLLAAAVAGALVLATSQPALVVLLLATAGSVLYETKYDPSGWKWADVLERELGIAVVVVALRLILGK